MDDDWGYPHDLGNLHMIHRWNAIQEQMFQLDCISKWSSTRPLGVYTIIIL